MKNNTFEKVLSYVVSILWFALIVLPWSVLALLMLFSLFSDTKVILVSGFSIGNTGISFIFISSLIFSITMLVPWFRKCYKKLPWLYVYHVMIIIDMLIVVIGNTILNYGYEVQSSKRHIMFIILMIIQLVVCRLAMCIYFKFKPLKNVKG